MSHLVRPELRLQHERFLAHVAVIRTDFGVSEAHVCLQVAVGGVRVLALVAAVWSLSRVFAQLVPAQHAAVTEAAAAVVTLPRLQARVDHLDNNNMTTSAREHE